MKCNLASSQAIMDYMRALEHSYTAGGRVRKGETRSGRALSSERDGRPTGNTIGKLHQGI
jgi:hypothetical protein